MTKEDLKNFSKDELIEIIMIDKYLSIQTRFKILDTISEKIDNILNKRMKCKLFSKEYYKLQKEYEKWTDLQENIKKTIYESYKI